MRTQAQEKVMLFTGEQMKQVRIYLQQLWLMRRSWDHDVLSDLSGSGATMHRRCIFAPADRQGQLNAKISDFGVKAGIGGFHPPRKQFAGKACNGVLIYM